MEILLLLFSFLIARIIPRNIKPFTSWIKEAFGLKRAKPFDCEACLSFWITLAIFTSYDVRLNFSFLSALCSYWIMDLYLSEVSREDVTIDFKLKDEDNEI